MEKIDFETQKAEFDAIFVSSSKNVENETKKNYLKTELPLTWSDCESVALSEGTCSDLLYGLHPPQVQSTAIPGSAMFPFYRLLGKEMLDRFQACFRIVAFNSTGCRLTPLVSGARASHTDQIQTDLLGEKEQSYFLIL